MNFLIEYTANVKLIFDKKHKIDNMTHLYEEN
jgi:hypothetical protein